MKKLLAILLTLAMLASIMPVAFAAEAGKVTASVDYYSNVITVEYTNPAAYSRYVNVYMANEDDVDGDVFTAFEKAVRMDMKQLKANETAVFTFKFAKDIDDGNYYFFAAPSGAGSKDDYAKSELVPVVSIDTAKDEILPIINESNDTNIAKNAFGELKEIFAFEEASSPAWKDAILYNIKADDFGGSFSNIAQVADAWKLADVIYAAKTEETDVKAKIEALVDAIGADKKDPDYVNFKDAFVDEYQKQLVISGADSKKDALESFEVAAAIVAVNNRDTEGKAEAIETYYKELGISDSLLAEMKAKSIVAVVRNMGDFTITSGSDLITKINAVLPNIGPAQNYKPQGGGGGFGGGNSGNIAIDPELEQQLNQPISTFNDVPNTHWAANSVGYLAKNNVISGVGNGLFAPDRTVTREEFVKMIVGAFNLTGKADIAFGDVDANHWAAEYIAIAVENGIVKGVSADKFGIGSKITRQDMAVIIARVAQLKGISLEAGEAVFTDAAKIDGYAKDAVELLAGAKVINGYEDGSFKPQGSLTRAEAAKVIYGIVAR